VSPAEPDHGECSRPRLTSAPRARRRRLDPHRPRHSSTSSANPVGVATTESLFVVGAALVGAADHAGIGDVRIKKAPAVLCARATASSGTSELAPKRSSCREQRPITTPASGSSTGALPRARVTVRRSCPE
jgi:hypothetical protein